MAVGEIVKLGGAVPGFAGEGSAEGVEGGAGLAVHRAVGREPVRAEQSPRGRVQPPRRAQVVVEIVPRRARGRIRPGNVRQDTAHFSLW